MNVFDKLQKNSCIAKKNIICAEVVHRYGRLINILYIRIENLLLSLFKRIFVSY